MKEKKGLIFMIIVLALTVLAFAGYLWISIKVARAKPLREKEKGYFIWKFVKN